ncbi:MAG: hypothetical protein ACXW3C_15895, partial [Pyrinomonadaceae bacterium]
MKSLVYSCACMIIVVSAALTNAQSNATPATLHRLADDYYKWRNQNYPVFSSDAGLHTWDSRLTDYSPAAIAARRAHVVNLLAQVKRMRTNKWKKDDRIDWLLFRAQLEGPVFFDRVMDFEHRDPQIYVNESSNGIFSLLKKEYDTPRNRARAATARLK